MIFWPYIYGTIHYNGYEFKARKNKWTGKVQIWFWKWDNLNRTDVVFKPNKK